MKPHIRKSRRDWLVCPSRKQPNVAFMCRATIGELSRDWHCILEPRNFFVTY